MGITEKILLGGHISTAGGISKSPERASVFHFGTMQIFSKNQRQWNAKALSEEEVSSFKKEVSKFGLRKMMVHASYLLNMGSSDALMKKKVGEALRIEVERANRMFVDYLVIHPGSSGGGSVRTAIANIHSQVNDAMSSSSHTVMLLETAAGQGNNLGFTFEQLAEMIDGITRKDLVGICFDTCHVFASGYDIKSPEGYAETMDHFSSQVGIKYLLGFHLNDSKGARGSRVDRHEQIGRGELGADGVANFINDSRLQNIPLVFETPKGEEGYADDIKILESVMR